MFFICFSEKVKKIAALRAAIFLRIEILVFKLFLTLLARRRRNFCLIFDVLSIFPLIFARISEIFKFWWVEKGKIFIFFTFSELARSWKGKKFTFFLPLKVKKKHWYRQVTVKLNILELDKSTWPFSSKVVKPFFTYFSRLIKHFLDGHFTDFIFSKSRDARNP